MGKRLGPSAGEASATSQTPCRPLWGAASTETPTFPWRVPPKEGWPGVWTRPSDSPWSSLRSCGKGPPPTVAPPPPCPGARALGGPWSRLPVAGVPPLPTAHRTVPHRQLHYPGRGNNEKILSPCSKTPHQGPRAPNPTLLPRSAPSQAFRTTQPRTALAGSVGHPHPPIPPLFLHPPLAAPW